MFVWFGVLCVLLHINNAKTKTKKKLSATCIGKTDGYHWLKLMGDTKLISYPPVYVLCDNKYMIIDVNQDPNLKSYFSSWDTYHYALAGTKDKFDSNNWENWWLPNAQFIETQKVNSDTKTNTNDESSDYFKYIISPSCDVCSDTANQDSIQKYADQTYADTYGDRTGYHMTGTMFGCLTSHKALRDCLWDWDSYECGFCTMEASEADHSYIYIKASDTDSIDTYQEVFESKAEAVDLSAFSEQWKSLMVGVCGVYPQSTYSDSAPTSKDDCFNVQPDPYKPSIGTDGRFCVCVQPTTQTHHYIRENTLKKYKKAYANNNGETETDEEGSTDDIYELYQSDFDDGTYRITKSGTYMIMEDIEFDFGAPENWHNPNQGDAWWPRVDQREEYPGAYSTRDEYFMGFFAGITVETSDVIIDLNSYKIAQSKQFYYQQRQFACISLKSVIFNLNQGPGIFGTDPKFASNVVIKNGDIGLSSHFGIHGVNNDNVLIENVHVYDFETHGIEMSYFTDLTISDVEIGPSSTIAYLKGEYAYARFSLQRMQMIQDNDNGGKSDFSEFPVQFGKRESSVTFHEIRTTLQTQMDIAFNYVMGVKEYDDDDEDFVAAKKLFVNEDGLPYGAVMYGLFLNLYVANVFIFHPSLRHSNNAEISNLKIHDLKHKSMEYVQMSFPQKARYQNPYSASLDASVLLGDEMLAGNTDIVWPEVTYKGDALTDAHIAMDLATSDEGITGFTWLESGFRDWAIHDDTSGWGVDESEHPYLGCNGDRMSHLLKGVIGIRADGVDSIEIDGLEMYNLNEHASLPKTVCGKYYDVWKDKKALTFRGGGHFLQNSPYSYGYTGNMAHGVFADWTTITMKGVVQIHDLYSDTGLIRGIAMMVNAHLVIEDSDDSDSDTLIEFYNLGAGIELKTTDVSALGHPFVAAIVQPISVYSESDSLKYEDDDSDDDPMDTDTVQDDADSDSSSDGDSEESDVFYGSISAETDDLRDWISVSCVYARSGNGVKMNDIGMRRRDIDNTNCNDAMNELITFNNDNVNGLQLLSDRNEWYYGSLFVIGFVVISVLIYVCVFNKNGKVKGEYERLNEQIDTVYDYGSAN